MTPAFYAIFFLGRHGNLSSYHCHTHEMYCPGVRYIVVISPVLLSNISISCTEFLLPEIADVDDDLNTSPLLRDEAADVFQEKSGQVNE